MRLAFKIGTGEQYVEVEDRNLVAVLEPQDLPSHPDEQQILKNSLSHPIGAERLKDSVHPGEKIAIITSDISRPCPSWKILPFVIDELKQAGVSESDITIYFALGSHRQMTAQEMEHLVGSDIFHAVACTCSNPSDTVSVGTTKRGTQVRIDRRVVEADRRICIGNVEYHYFAGFSGGAKAIFPGMSTPDSIAMNHKWMIDPASCTGKLKENPVREDIEEAASLVGCDFILNVVLNPDKEIVYAASGDMIKAHRKACAYLADAYQCRIPEKADIVIVSQGGAPKDLNLYQLQKALDNAKYAVKEGGTIILVGSAREGFGNKNFEEWMLKYHSGKEMSEALQQHFVLGGHKAAAIAMVSDHAEIDLVSEMNSSIVSQTVLKPYDNIEEAYMHALINHGANSTVIAMPYGGSTLPSLD